MGKYVVLSSGRPIRYEHGSGKVRVFGSIEQARKAAKQHPGRKVARLTGRT